MLAPVAAPPGRRAGALRCRRRCCSPCPALGHEDPRGQPADAARLDPRGADRSRGSPRSSRPRAPPPTVVVKAPAADRAEVAPALRRAGPRRRSPPTTSSARVGTRCGSRRTAPPRCSTLAMPYDESDPKVDGAITLAARRPRAGSARATCTREHAVGGGAAESLDYVDRQHDRLPIVIGVVLLLTLLMMGVRLPQRADRADLDGAEPGLGRRGVRDPDAGLPARLGRGCAGLHQPGLRDRLDPAVRDGGAGRAVDGLPRVRAQPDPRARAATGCRPGSPSSAGIRDTAGVVTSAAAVMVSVFAIFATLSMMEMKMMGVGLSAAILIDATADPAGDAAGDPGAARRPGLVADAADRRRWARPWWRASRRTRWPVRARCDRTVRSSRSPRARRARGLRRWGRRR